MCCYFLFSYLLNGHVDDMYVFSACKTLCSSIKNYHLITEGQKRVHHHYICQPGSTQFDLAGQPITNGLSNVSNVTLRPVLYNHVFSPKYSESFVSFRCASYSRLIFCHQPADLETQTGSPSVLRLRSLSCFQ